MGATPIYPNNVPWANGKWTWDFFKFNVSGRITPEQNLPPMPGLWGSENYPQIITDYSGPSVDNNSSFAFAPFSQNLIDSVGGYQTGWWELDLEMDYEGTTLTTTATITLHYSDHASQVVNTLNCTQTVSNWDSQVDVSLSTLYTPLTLSMDYNSTLTSWLVFPPQNPLSKVLINLNLSLNLSESGWSIDMSPFYFTDASSNYIATLTTWDFSGPTPLAAVNDAGAPNNIFEFSHTTSSVNDLIISSYDPSLQPDGYPAGFSGQHNVSLTASVSPSIIEAIKLGSQTPIVAFSGDELTAYDAIRSYDASQLPEDSAQRGTTYSDLNWIIPTIPLDCPSGQSATVQANWTAVATQLNAELSGLKTVQALFNNINDILDDVYSNNILTIGQVISFFKLTDSGPVKTNTTNFLDFLLSTVNNVLMSVAVVDPELKAPLTVMRSVLGIVQAAAKDFTSTTSSGQGPSATAASIFDAQNSLQAWYNGIKGSVATFYTDFVAYEDNLESLGRLDSTEFSISSEQQQTIVDSMSHSFAKTTFAQIASTCMSLKRYRACSDTDAETQGEPALGNNPRALFPYQQAIPNVNTINGEGTSDLYFWSKIMLDQGNANNGVYGHSSFDNQNDGTSAANPVNFSQDAYDWITKGVKGNWAIMSDYEFFNLNLCKMPINSGEGYPKWNGWVGNADIT